MAGQTSLRMAARTQPAAWSGPSRRRVPRFRMLVPLNVTVLRSGIPDTLPGRALNVCERGMGAIVAGELVTGESVGVEIRLSATGDPLRTRAMVRYHDKLQYGLEFTAISNEQRNTIRDWAKGIKPIAERGSSTAVLNGKAEPASEGRGQYFRHAGGGGGRPVAKRKSRWKLLLGRLFWLCSQRRYSGGVGADPGQNWSRAPGHAVSLGGKTEGAGSARNHAEVAGSSGRARVSGRSAQATLARRDRFERYCGHRWRGHAHAAVERSGHSGPGRDGCTALVEI